jgi:hypothetical protein
MAMSIAGVKVPPIFELVAAFFYDFWLEIRPRKNPPVKSIDSSTLDQSRRPL